METRNTNPEGQANKEKESSKNEGGAEESTLPESRIDVTQKEVVESLENEQTRNLIQEHFSLFKRIAEAEDGNDRRDIAADADELTYNEVLKLVKAVEELRSRY